ncbi:MAG: hypothetical protein V1799_09705 [bacterium]
MRSQFTSADILQCIIARYFEGEHGASTVSIGFAPKWDIRFSDGSTWEIKFDSMARSTLNAAIEYWDTRRNKATGILETEASKWLHLVPDGNGIQCYEMNTVDLIRLCFECGKVKAGGDYDASLMKIIPLQDIKRISIKHFYLEDELLNKVRY